MRGRDKLDAVDSRVRKAKHHIEQFVSVDCLARVTVTADDLVLTVRTPEVATRKKHRTRAAHTGQYGLFPHMRCASADAK